MTRHEGEGWHTDQYLPDDGLPFKKAIIDALTANPDGLTIVGVRDWLYQERHFVTIATYSWLRSFGHEKCSATPGGTRPDARKHEAVAHRYNGWPLDDSQPDAQVRYGLTERLDYWAGWMQKDGQVETAGNVPETDTIFRNIRSGPNRYPATVYRLGKQPLKVRGSIDVYDAKGRLKGTRIGLINYQPFAIDWGQREILWRKHLEEALARKTSRPGELRGLLMEADRIFTRQDDRWPA